MVHLPVIVGFGGLNAAGRSSFHHAYRRLVIDSLPKQRVQQTWRALASMMGMPCSSSDVGEEEIAHMRAHTLIRRIESEHFDVDRTRVHLSAKATVAGTKLKLAQSQSFLKDIPSSWCAHKDADGALSLELPADAELMVPHYLPLPARGAGQLPSGCVLGGYGSRRHPRGLEMSVYALSDALNSLGMDWDELCKRVPPDQISVYSGSAMGQMDDFGGGGVLRARLLGSPIGARCCPLSLAEMPADFSNAYVLGTMGNTGGVTGACATLLYNLRAAVNDIRTGAAQIAVVGASEAPIVPDILAAYIAMGALATDEGLRKLDGVSGEPDWRMACRPFAENCGFTIAESAQYFILFSDALALETGADIHAALAEVCVNADGYKKSISSSGAGNYLTVARALASLRALLGEAAVQNSYVMAHGTGTPQNRVTESHVLNENAKWFGISSWPVAAIKCFLGHSVATAAGDQLAAVLGVWQEGLIPGIATMSAPAEDVHRDHLKLSKTDTAISVDEVDCALINSKGFGGNNATGAVLSPRCTEDLLRKRHGDRAIKDWRSRAEKVRARAADCDAELIDNGMRYHYRFDYRVYGEDAVRHARRALLLHGRPPVDLDVDSPYPDMGLSDHD